MSIGDGERFDVVAIGVVKVRVCSDMVPREVDNSVPIVGISEPNEWKRAEWAISCMLTTFDAYPWLQGVLQNPQVPRNIRLRPPIKERKIDKVSIKPFFSGLSAHEMYLHGCWLL